MFLCCCIKSRASFPKQINCVFFKQAWASCSAFAAAMAIGASAGFSGVTIPQLQDRNQTFYLTDEEISWFGRANFDPSLGCVSWLESVNKQFFLCFLASLPTFATIPTCIFGGLMGQAYGRRLSLVLVAPLFATSFICQAAAPDVGLFQFGRLLSGIAAGLVSSPASVRAENRSLAQYCLQQPLPGILIYFICFLKVETN